MADPVTRQRITEISNSLKRWYAESLDVTQFPPDRARQFHSDVAHGLNDCLAYIEQMEAGQGDPAKAATSNG